MTVELVASQHARQLEPHLVADLRVDVTQRIVEQHDARPPDQAARQRGALLLALRQCLRQVIKHMVDPQHASRLVHPLDDLRFGDAARPQRAGDVVERRHVRIEGVVLERHADVAVLGIDVGHRLAVDRDVAAVWRHHAGDQPQEHGLAAARRAKHDQELALVDSDRRIVDDLMVLEGLRQASDFQECHRSLLQPLMAPRLRPSTR